MLDDVHAVFRDGAFYPTAPCFLPNESKVVLRIQPDDSTNPPSPRNDEERKRILERVTERMRNNPIPADAPTMPFSREWLHERG